MFAVNGIDVMDQQPAVGALVTHFVGPKQRPQKLQKQANPNHHNDNCQDPSSRSDQGDIAEPGGG